MKIAFYNHTSDVSGAEISLLLTAKHLPEAQPILFAPNGELSNRAEEIGIPWVPIQSYRARLTKNPIRLIRDVCGILWSGYRFALAVRKHQPDIVHANSLRAGMMSSLFRWLHRKPVIWHVRDNPPGGLIGKGIRLLAKRSAQSLIGISQAVLTAFDHPSFRDKKFLIHNGVELQDIPVEQKKQHHIRLREEFHTPTSAKLAVVIGQITPWKRQMDAIEALAKLVRQGQDLYMWIVGEAKFRQENIAYEQQLRETADRLGVADRVRFTGFRRDVAEICCAADLLILCSENEPFGRVLIEAMAQSIPVVATRGGGVPEIVEHGQHGYLYEIGDVDGLVHMLSLLVQDDTLRIRMGIQAVERVRGFFTIERTSEKVEEVYRAMMLSGEGRRKSPSADPTQPRVAIVHDYLNQAGGAERVVGVLHRMFPEAPIFTTILDRNKLLPELQDADIRVTWMQRIPGIMKRFKQFFWLYPLAMKSMKLQEYDLVISSSSAFGKGAPVRKDAQHICYCHTPMRFAWDFHTYMESVPVPAVMKRMANMMVRPLRVWDRATTKNVDVIIANSTIVKKRIETCYDRAAPVIFPPVNVFRFEVNERPEGDYFLVVSRLVSYKRIDLAVEACTKGNLPLVIIGAGPDRQRLESLAGPSVRFMGRLSDEEVSHYMCNCRAFLFPGIEDFGITPLEVNACGRPVIAFQAGGALDTVVPGLNGQYFTEQTPESLLSVLQRFEDRDYKPELIRRHAERFDESRFVEELMKVVRGLPASYERKRQYEPVTAKTPVNM